MPAAAHGARVQHVTCAAVLTRLHDQLRCALEHVRLALLGVQQ
jgi:hypothetical protein